MPSEGGKRERAADPVFTVNGWTLLMHPCFLDQVEKLAAAVEAERAEGKAGGTPTANAKLLRRIVEIAFDEVPQDPSHKRYRHGKTIRGGRSHWFRAKFGGGRFRLFFRFSSAERLIVYAWVNDEDSLRTYGSRTDAYRVFADRLDRGDPPDGWKALMAGAESAEAQTRAEALAKRVSRKK